MKISSGSKEQIREIINKPSDAIDINRILSHSNDGEMDETTNQQT